MLYVRVLFLIFYLPILRKLLGSSSPPSTDEKLMKRSIPRIRSSAKNQRKEEEEEEVIGFSVLLSAGNGRCQNGKEEKKYLRNADEFLPSSLCTVRRLPLSFSPQ